MNQLEINKIIGRIKYWKGFIGEQYALKKDDRNEERLTDAENRINILKGWLKGTVVNIGKGGIAVEKKVLEAMSVMSKEEFKRMANQALGTTAEPGAVMVIHDRKGLDLVYEKIKMANIQISAPPDVLAYYREKLRKERPYKQ